MPVSLDAGAKAPQESAECSAAPAKVPAQRVESTASQEKEQDEEEDRRSYSVSPVEPDAEINLASSLLWDDYGESLAQFLSRLYQEVAKCSAAEKIFRQRVGYLLYQNQLQKKADQVGRRPGPRRTSGTITALLTKRIISRS